MYKFLSTSRGSDDLSFGFDRSRDRRQSALTNIKNSEGKYHVRIYLKDIFGFADYQETGNYGLSFNLTMTGNTDNAVVNNNNAINNAKIKVNAIESYVPYYTMSLEEYNKLMNQIVEKTPTGLHYPEKDVFMKEVNTQKFWTFKLGVPEGINIPIWIYVVFQQSDRQHDQSLNTDTFYRMPVTSAQCNIGNQKHPDTSNLLN